MTSGLWSGASLPANCSELLPQPHTTPGGIAMSSVVSGFVEEFSLPAGRGDAGG